MWTGLALLGGLIALVFGADYLVKGASGLAARFGVPPWLVGLTVVAFGTSAPELAVSIQGALTGRPDLAIGNVMGSNTFNVLGILGISAVVTPLVVARKLIRFDIPLMILCIGALYPMLLDGVLGFWEGFALVVTLFVWTGWSIRVGRAEGVPDEPGDLPRPRLIPRLAETLGGLVLLVIGARLLVDGASEVARWLGWSELVIGLTVVAVGTSLPEVAATLAAAVKGERDLAVGNVVGSNLFNVLCVLGFTALVAPEGLPVPPAVLQLDLPVAFAASAVTLPIVFRRELIRRREGVLMLAWYLLYLGVLVLDATGHPLRQAYLDTVYYAVLPLTVVLLAAFVLERPRAAA